MTIMTCDDKKQAKQVTKFKLLKCIKALLLLLSKIKQSPKVCAWITMLFEDNIC